MRLWQCWSCKARFSPKLYCEVCTHPTCPQCNKCDCSRTNRHQPKSERTFHRVWVKDLPFLQKQYDLEVRGTLSPMKGQKQVQTRHGPTILSLFEIQDETGTVPFLVWGRLPRVLFERRYDFIPLIVKGVRVTESPEDGQLELVLQRNGMARPSQDRFTRSLLSYLYQPSQKMVANFDDGTESC